MWGLGVKGFKHSRRHGKPGLEDCRAWGGKLLSPFRFQYPITRFKPEGLNPKL